MTEKIVFIVMLDFVVVFVLNGLQNEIYAPVCVTVSHRNSLQLVRGATAAVFVESNCQSHELDILAFILNIKLSSLRTIGVPLKCFWSVNSRLKAGGLKRKLLCGVR